MRKKSELIDYISQIFDVRFTIFLLDQLIAIAGYLKKRKSGVIAEKVFSNPFLAENIARNLDMHQLNRFRGVNKSLNNSCLGVIRKDHRVMKIEFMQFVHEFLSNQTIIVHVNLVPVRLSEFSSYLRFLDKLANSLVADSQSKEECYKLLEDCFARPNISCTTLALCIHENRDTDNTETPQDHTPIPWEVLKMALRKWKVQRIEIKLVRILNDMPHIESWSRSNYFTGIRFNDPVDNLRGLEFSQKFSQVKVDLSRSVHCTTDLMFQGVHRGYKNVIANIRRIFHPDQISVEFTHWRMPMDPSNPQELLENFLRISRLGFHQNLAISFKIYITIEEISEVSKKFKAVGPPRAVYKNVMDPKNLFYFKSGKWVGQLYRFLDFGKNFILNAEIFVEEENLKKVMLEEHQAIEFMDMFQLDVFE
ncbi:hypothetical protein CAEBREN_03154 [Caenorhabditis brenneri]|uniref:Uncharacterized protein n=1 Tax=Caenorhabditis brenneri TaxID=135651 RepID=G0NNE0_CAEBE|nr:hypothetical protein CAEBREN_03154 [Caenorhabditis brenneri]